MIGHHNLNLNSRRPASMTLAAGEVRPLYVGGDFVFLRSVSAGSVEVSVNGDQFAPMDVGTIHSGVVGRNDIGNVVFRNPGGAPVTIGIIFGKGRMEILGNVTATIAGSVTVAEPAAADVTWDGDVIAGGPVVYADKRSLSIFNAGAANVVVTLPSGAKNLPPGAFMAWRNDRQNERGTDVSVDATGSSAIINWTQ